MEFIVHRDGEDELQHYGIKGQRHGQRRWQYADGSLTPEGKRRYEEAKRGRQTGVTVGLEIGTQKAEPRKISEVNSGLRNAEPRNLSDLSVIERKVEPKKISEVNSGLRNADARNLSDLSVIERKVESRKLSEISPERKAAAKSLVDYVRGAKLKDIK